MQVDFLEACWERSIVCLLLPAHLSGVFQPLDLNFFSTLKLEYHKQVNDYQLGSEASSIPKTLLLPMVSTSMANDGLSAPHPVGMDQIWTVSVERAGDASQDHYPRTPDAAHGAGDASQ